MNAYAHHPAVSTRVATAFFTDYIEQCDDPDAFAISERNDRIVTVSAPPDALIELWAHAMQTGSPRSAPSGTEPHIIASAARSCALLLSDVGDLRHEAMHQSRKLCAPIATRAMAFG